MNRERKPTTGARNKAVENHRAPENHNHTPEATLSCLRAPLKLDALKVVDEPAAELIGKVRFRDTFSPYTIDRPSQCLQRNTTFRPTLDAIKGHDYFRKVYALFYPFL